MRSLFVIALVLPQFASHISNISDITWLEASVLLIFLAQFDSLNGSLLLLLNQTELQLARSTVEGNG